MPRSSLVAVVALVLGIAACAADPEPACPPAAAEVAGVWSPAAKSALRQAASQRSTADQAGVDQLVARLDAEVAAWATLSDAACGAEVQPALREARRRCLDGVLDARDEVVAAAGRAPAGRLAQFDPLDLNGVPSVWDCAVDDAVLARPAPPSDPGAETGVRLLRRKLSRAALAGWAAGDPRKASSALSGLLEQATLIGREDVVLEARLLDLQHTPTRAAPDVLSLADDAVAAGHAAVEAGALLAGWRALPDRESAFARAEAAVQQAGGPLSLRRDLAVARGELLLRAGRAPEAVAEHRSLLADLTAAGATPLERADVRLRLAALLQGAGDLDGAAEEARAAVAEVAAFAGDHAPATVAARAGAGRLLGAVGQTEGAREMLSSAAVDQAAVLGASHPAAARTAIASATAAWALGDRAAAAGELVALAEALDGAPEPDALGAALALVAEDPAARSAGLQRARSAAVGVREELVAAQLEAPDAGTLRALAWASPMATLQGVGGTCAAEGACGPALACAAATALTACDGDACCTPRCTTWAECGLGHDCRAGRCVAP